MVSNNDYAWNTPYRNGKLTKWMQVLELLEKTKASKYLILLKLYGYNTVKRHDIRGYCSHMFCCMHNDGLIDYNRHTGFWEITTKGRKILRETHRNAYVDIVDNPQIVGSHKSLASDATNYQKTSVNSNNKASIKDLLSNANFGDKFHTRNGKPALFLRLASNSEYDFAMMYVKDFGQIQVFLDSGKCCWNSDYDIVCKLNS